MTLLRRLTIALAALLVMAPAAQAQSPEGWPQRDAARVYFFGNSLIHHLTDSDDTTVPRWLAFLAGAAGHKFNADGRWGFPRNFATELPPDANWRFKSVKRAWEPGRMSFRAARFDTVIFNPENYIQYDPADRPYPDNKRPGETPLAATLTVFDWVLDNADAPRLLIYEGWADLHPFAKALPASPREMSRYYRHAQGKYHRWYVDYVAMLQDARPDAEIVLLPVGSVMAQMLSSDLLLDIPSEALYSDLSPHGTATIYLLAAMITYVALYGEPPPPGVALPDGVIDPRFAERYDQIAAETGRLMLTPGADG